jgi:L1 cell adhesion molecule like protein
LKIRIQPFPANDLMDCDVIGIDLGTTYSSVGRLVKQGPQLVPDGAKYSIPSFVAYQKNRWEAGRVALTRAVQHPKTTVYDIKRMFGCSFNMSEIQRAIPSWQFPVVSGHNGEILIEIQEETGPRQYHPYELSAKILVKLKEMAAAEIGHSVTDAVITVPANFNDAQREETRLAAKEAGLTVLRLANEPTAGAIAYGFQSQSTEAKTVVVFDFGGGTLDVSLIDIEGMKFRVRAVAGDTHLGGRDIDDLLMELCMERFDPSGATTVQRLTPRKRHSLWAKCEDAKCDLSDSTSAVIFLEDFSDAGDLDVTITREDLEARCRPLFDRILAPVQEALARAELAKERVNEVLMIGGSSMIPWVKTVVGGFFNKRPFSGVSALEAVTRGAAIMAGMIKGGGTQIIDLQLQDICPVSLGIKVFGDRMSVMIRAGTPLPVTKTATFFTIRHNQTEAPCEIYEGPWLMTKRNKLLASFTVSGISPAEAGEEKVEVTFSLDLNQILTATAVVSSQGTSSELTVTKIASLDERGPTSLTEDERQREKELDEREHESAGRASALKNLATNLELFFTEQSSRDVRFSTSILPWMQTDILTIVRDKLPGDSGAVPSPEEVNSVFEQVQDILERRFIIERNAIPTWLTYTEY